MNTSKMRKIKSGAQLKAAWEFSGANIILRPTTIRLGPKVEDAVAEESR